jgi:exodeoxyribonuclease V alpha subunit
VVNKDTPLSIASLNTVIQKQLNGSAKEVRGCPFRVGDKVINTRNSWLLPAHKWCRQNDRITHSKEATVNQDGALYCANGEFGVVEHIDSKSIIVRMVEPHRIVSTFRETVEEGSEQGQTGSCFQLGYAITTHKSQGSQFKFVIAMIDGSSRFADRSLWYTMITRTKKACWSIGKKQTIVSASARSAVDQRKTFLVERLHGELRYDEG